jgi:hypothetical protein
LKDEETFDPDWPAGYGFKPDYLSLCGTGVPPTFPGNAAAEVENAGEPPLNGKFRLSKFVSK